MSKRHLTEPAVVLVTGCSSGIGRAICDQLAQTGSRVYGGSRSACAPRNWTYLTMDVTDAASVDRVVDEVVQREGRIDALFTSAGFSLAGSVEDTSDEEAKEHFETNFFGTMRTIRAVLPVMRKQGFGKIAAIGSIGGLIGLPFIAYYSAAKFALDGAIEALRGEAAPFGIQATIIHPGDLNTALGAQRRFARNSGASSAYAREFRKTLEFYEAQENNAPLPTAVATAAQKVLSIRSLPVRIVVGSPLERLGVVGKRLLPGRGFEYVLRKAYGA